MSLNDFFTGVAVGQANAQKQAPMGCFGFIFELIKLAAGIFILLVRRTWHQAPQPAA